MCKRSSSEAVVTLNGKMPTTPRSATSWPQQQWGHQVHYNSKLCFVSFHSDFIDLSGPALPFCLNLERLHRLLLQPPRPRRLRPPPGPWRASRNGQGAGEAVGPGSIQTSSRPLKPVVAPPRLLAPPPALLISPNFLHNFSHSTAASVSGRLGFISKLRRRASRV